MALAAPTSFIEALFLVNENHMVKSIPVSPATLSPGDIAFFIYKDLQGKYSRRQVLVCSTKMHPGGSYLSVSTNNRLLTAFELPDSIPVLVIVLETLFKNRIRCKYHKVPKILSMVLGKRNFRTFRMNDISNIAELEIIHGS